MWYKQGGKEMVEDWQHFLLPYQQAVNELKVKLRGMRKQYQDRAQHSPIEFNWTGQTS